MLHRLNRFIAFMSKHILHLKGRKVLLADRHQEHRDNLEVFPAFGLPANSASRVPVAIEQRFALFFVRVFSDKSYQFHNPSVFHLDTLLIITDNHKI